jgi:hypothetical protein
MDDVMMLAGVHSQLSFADMRDEERLIIKALERAAKEGTGALRIAELQAANGWDLVDEHDCSDGYCETCAEALRRGNSKVRNNLRRLMRYGWIHRPVDGTYALISKAEPLQVVERSDPVEPEPPQPAVQLVVEPPQPVVRSSGPLVQIRKKNRQPNPIELSQEDAMRAHMRARKEDYSLVSKIKRPDCTFYNACLDQAINGQWAGFACTNCSAYALPDRHQQEIDLLGCLGVNKARELLEEHGKVMRVRGVKPGADAKRTTIEDEEDFAEAM